MAEVKVLIPGYTNADSADRSDEEETSCPTITLIKDKDMNIIVDPGVLEDQQILIDALEKEGLSIEDIDIVFLTHSHIDHYRNTGMFPNAKTLEFYGIWEKNKVEDWKEQFTEDIKIIKTPGHDSSSLTFLVKIDKGTVAICGDVFWKKDYPKDDPYASKPDKLIESRKLILELADYIVPGHADMYKVEK